VRERLSSSSSSSSSLFRAAFDDDFDDVDFDDVLFIEKSFNFSSTAAFTTAVIFSIVGGSVDRYVVNSKADIPLTSSHRAPLTHCGYE